jgi:hypothetical protein
LLTETRTRTERPGRNTQVLRLFAVTWAMATLFHVWVNPRSLDVFGHPDALGVLHVVLTVVALWVMWRPSSLVPLTVLCSLQVGVAAVEMPYLGNHWLLVALVALGWFGALCTGGDVARRFPPVARVTLLVAYGFAAFSKLNEGFFTPSASCGPFYAREALNVWGLAPVLDLGPVQWLIIVATVAVECSVPVLLVFRRTRHLGVLAGLVFHSLIALDTKHLFTDFSAVLLALFLLFLPPSFAPWLRERARRWRYRPLPLIAVAALISVLQWASRGMDGEPPPAAQALGFLLWLAFDVAVLVAVAGYLRRERPRAEPGMLRIAPAWLALVPALALVNGLTPYLELKTGFGWNMYSNLVTVDGRSNHLLVRRTFPATDEQRHLVTVLASNDSRLTSYATNGYRIPLLQLRDYAGRHPASSLRYELDGVVREAPRIGADPVLGRDVPQWRAKLQLFRAVDEQDPPRCLDRWGAAR